MKRLLKAAGALLCAIGIPLFAQMTNVTASKISMGGVPIASGTVAFTPVNTMGTAIAFSTGGGGLNSPGAFSCSIAAGAITDPCQIPDSALTSPANILYAIQITNTATQRAFTLQAVANVTGTSWALDSYGPPTTTTNAEAVLVSYGSAAPPSTCASPSFYIQDASGGKLYICVGGAYVIVGGSAASTVLAPQNMPERSNLLGEYLLDEGTGTVANDTSGLGNNATISGATWEGTTDLNFGSVGEYIQLPTALNATKTWQIAAYMPPFGEGVAPLPQGYGDATAFGQNPSLLCGTDNAHLCLIANALGAKSMRFNAYTTDQTEAAEPMTAGWHVLTFICGSASLKTHILYDGAEVGSYINQGGASTCPTNLTSGNYQIGGSTALTGTWFVGKVAAAWAWSTQLSLSEASAAAKSALDYIHAKGVPQLYRSAIHAAPLVIGGIDSRTAGVAVTSPWIDQLTLTDSTYTTLNLGQSGSVTYDICAMFDLLYGVQIAQTANSVPVITVIWGGVNDFGVSITTRQTADNLRCIVQKAKKLGSRVVLATEISSSENANGDPSKDTLDPIIRAEAYGWGVDNIADLATDPHLGADGASANTACFSAGLHPMDACEPYVTAIMSNAVNELLGSTETNRHTAAGASYQEVAGDRFLDLTGTVAQTVSLPDCIGYSLPRQIVNLGAVAATVAPVDSETLKGGTSIGIGVRAVFVPIPGALAAAGCSWERTQ